MSDGFAIRPAGPDDMAFVIDAWLEGYWMDGPFSLVMPKSAWWPRWHRVIENILADERTRTVIACLEERPDQLMGIACSRPPDILHWVYVKQAFRGNGIAIELLDVELPARCSHWTVKANRFNWHQSECWSYDPAIIKEYQP